MLSKRIGISLLAAAMAVSLTACSFLSIPSAVQELLSSGEEISGSPAPASDAGDNAGKETPASQEDNGSGPEAEKAPAPHQENKDQKDGKPLSLFWAEDEDLGWKDGELLYTADWDYLYLSDEDAAAYPALAGALDALNQQAASSGALWSEKLKEIVEEKTWGGDLGGYHGQYTQRNVVRRADQTVLSILHYMELDSIDNFESVLLGTTNLDPATGRELTLADVFADPDALPALLAEQCRKDGLDIGGQEEHFADCMARGDFRWVVGYQNVAFDFPVPELSPHILYAGSSLPVSLWYHDAPDQFREKFRSPPDQYVVKVDPQRPLEVDLDSRDGHKDYIDYSSAPGWLENGPGWLEIGVNDQWDYPLSEEELAFCGTFELYLVHLGEGKNLLYMNELSDNAYYTLLVYSLEEMRLLENLRGMGFHEEFTEDGEKRRAMFTDPSSFTLYTLLEMLGTMWGTCEYQVDPSTGLPAAKQPYFDLLNDNTLTARIPVEAAALPGETRESIPAGTQLSFLRTDCQSYVDMRTEDGREYRIFVDGSQWPATVNGVPVDECFDGMLYTG